MNAFDLAGLLVERPIILGPLDCYASGLLHHKGSSRGGWLHVQVELARV
jgi:hypothetical protein